MLTPNVSINIIAEKNITPQTGILKNHNAHRGTILINHLL